MNKPYAESCDQNRDVILEVIRPLLANRQSVLEIGSGTGQHVVYFARQLAQLQWQPSDKGENLPGIQLWLDEAQLVNVSKPLEIDVTQPLWPDMIFDAVFSANTLHIMHWDEVKAFFKGVAQCLHKGGLLIVYGPFNYNKQYTSESNARFDAWLKNRDPGSGIRDFEALDQLAQQQGMQLLQDYAMPANNRILCWQKTG
jgi:cyclopropane fatty-acyl-phospholipid synthase-like methyltransferase